MPVDFSPEDREKILQLGIATQERALAWEEAVTKRQLQRRLAVDLVQREVISQARAAKICEVDRQTIYSWLVASFEGRDIADR